jgi:PAS domain S-box-containing protein
LTADLIASIAPIRETSTRLLPRLWRGLQAPPAPLGGAVRIAKATESLLVLPWFATFNFVLAALTAAALAELHGPAVMAAWLAAVAATAYPGTRHWLRFRHAPPPTTVSPRFHRKAAIYSTVVAMPWLVLLVLLFPYDSESHEIAVIFVVAGISAGAIAMLPMVPEVTLAYLLPLLLGLVQALARDDQAVDLVMAAMTVAYMIFLVGVVAFRHEQFVAGIAVRENAKDLARALAQARARLAQAYTSADETVVIFDSEERLVISNFNARSPLAGFGNLPEIGTTFADGLRALVRAGAFAAGNRDEAEFMAKILAAWRNPPANSFIELANGNYLRIAVRALGNGEKAVILSDATETVAHAKAARAHERRLADFAETSGEWWWEQDADLRFTSLSDRLTDHLGESPDRYVGKRRDEIVDPAFNHAAWQNHLADLAARRPFRDFRYRLRVGSGAGRYVSVSGKPLFDAAGKFLGYRGVARDVTADVEAAETLRLAKEQAVYASHAKSQFLAHMSHELRTPLNAVIGYSEMMAQGTFGPLGNEKYVEYVGHIRDSGAHLLSLIDDILEMSTVESGGRRLNEETVDLRRLVRASMYMVEGRARDAGVAVRTELALPLPAVRGDARLLKQVLLNLLTNAVKFTPSGGQVTLAAAAGRAGVNISVSDTGIGMSAENIAAAWTPFARGNSEHAQKYPGAGLGLPLVKGLVELHGGTVAIQSVVGQGTTISVHLPASRIIPDAARQASA